MNSISESADRQSNQNRTQTTETESERSGINMEGKYGDPQGLGAGQKCSDRRKPYEADQAWRDQAVLNLVAHWARAGRNVGSAVASDLRILFALDEAAPETRRRLAMRIAAGSLTA